MTRDGPLSLSELRERALKLSDLQVALHERLSSYMASTGDSVSVIAAKAGAARPTLLKFHKNELCMCSGRSLNSLCAFLDCSELGNDIVGTAKPIPDYLKSLGSFSPRIINLVVDLMVTYQSHAEEVTVIDFAAAFEPYAEVVKGAVKGSFAALQQLSSEEVVLESVLVTLIDNLDNRLVQVAQAKTGAKQPLIDELKNVVDKLLINYERKTVITAELGLSETALSAALSGRASLQQIEHVLELAKQLLAGPSDIESSPTEADSSLAAAYRALHEHYGSQRGVAEALGMPASTLWGVLNGHHGNPDKIATILEAAQQLSSEEPTDTVAVPEPTPTETAEDQPTDVLTLAALSGVAGITTPEGVPFVLTEASFQQLADVSVIALRDSLINSIRVARMLLNVGSQVQDRKDRRLLQEGVSREVEELELAIRTFSFAHPNRLVELYDSQREVWGDQPPSPKPKKGQK